MYWFYAYKQWHVLLTGHNNSSYHLAPITALTSLWSPDVEVLAPPSSLMSVKCASFSTAMSDAKYALIEMCFFS